jgi:hypothetical protein
VKIVVLGAADLSGPALLKSHRAGDTVKPSN